MMQRLLVALFFALEQYLAALVDRHRKKLKEEEERAELGEKIDAARSARTRQEKQDAAKKITESF